MRTIQRITRANALLLCLMAGLATADEKTDALIDAVVSAYGGDAVIEMANYEITERYISPATGQSWSPELVDIGATNQHLVHDLKNGSLYFENWFLGRGGQFTNVVIVQGDNAWAVNPRTESYGAAAASDPYTIAGGTMRTTDTLLVRELAGARDAAEYMGSASFYNRDHEMIKVPFPQSPDLTLYVDKESHLINRMTRENPQLGLLDYVFSNHQTINGIARATQTHFFVAGAPNLIASERKMRFNQLIPASRFELPEGLEEEGKRLDDSETIVNRLSRNVYHIGQGGAYSIFVDTGREIIGSGGYPGLSQRFERFQKESGSHRPLRYQVVTHHHSDHLGGVGEALDLGAQLVTVQGNIEAIAGASGREPAAGRFLSVNQRLTLAEGDGQVELYDVSTIHSRSNLLVYVPSVKTLFIADHLNSPYEKGVPAGNLNTVTMAQALEGLDLKVNKIVTAHGGRVYSERDLKQSAAGYTGNACPQGWSLCEA